MTSDIRPDLLFGLGASTGFSSSGVASFDDLRPAAVVRELIQNSLDAAREAKTSPAVVRFRLRRIDQKQIPGIKAYKAAFCKAIKRQHDSETNTLHGQAQLTVDQIETALNEERLDVLSIMDNGGGIDNRRMDALLSDGVSAKEGQATGTYGNGHFTAIPASNLRYILYGGVIADGSRIGSGHAILASHIGLEEEEHLRGADGFFIRGFQATSDTLYEYADDQDIPDLISQDLTDIKSHSGHGTTVIITAFNHFLEDRGRSLWNMVSEAASANFFIAIANDHLKVIVEDLRDEQHSEPQTLDRSTLRDVLTEHQGKKRSAAFLSGRRAFDAHRAFQSGKVHDVETDAGEVVVHLQEKASGTTHIDLCRNGMWITDDKSIPIFRYKFTARAPFHAVLSLNPDGGRDLYNLIRLAEGPLHDSIRLKRLPPGKKKCLQGALIQIRDWILDNTTPIQSDAYSPDDFFTSDFGDNAGGGNGKSRKTYWARTPVAAKRRPARKLHPPSPGEKEPGTPEPENRPGQRRNSNANRARQRPSLPALFRAASLSIGEHRRRIVVECIEDYTDTELRLVVDEALDVTCDRPNQDDYAPATLENVTVDGKPASPESLCTLDGRVIGIRLGNLKAGSSIEVETDYALSGDFHGLPDPSLRAELFRSRTKPEADGQNNNKDGDTQ